MEEMQRNERISRLLVPGEYLLWSGTPAPGHILTGGDVFLIPFSLVWCGFSLFWEWTAISQAGWPFAVFGIPFVLIGLYLLIGRFIHRAVKRRNTVYAVTDTRMIEVSGRKVNVIERAVIEHLSLELNADGSGSITVNERTEYRRSRRGRFATSVNDFCFDNISDVNTVYQLLSAKPQ